MNRIENESRQVSRHVSRRGFLQGALAGGVFVLSARFIPEPLWAAEGEAAARAVEPSLWMSIASDGTVAIVAHRSEMGCGSRTALPLVVADELDADWSKVKIEQAIGDPKYGDQDTDGSHSVRSNFDLMREVGATGRAMLISAAAAQWGVSPTDCTTEAHFVVHRASGRKLGHGEVAAAAAKLPVPRKEDVPLKPRAEWRYIGKESNSLFDLPEIVTGKAAFGIDATMSGMVFASVEHPPVLGQKIKSYDDKAALKVPGVQRTLTIDAFKPPHQFQPLGGVAVIADNTWAAFKGRKGLKIEWDVHSSPHAVYNSAPFRKTLEATSRQPGKVVRNVGDVDAAFAKSAKIGGKIIEAEYYTPHLAHVSMEPPVAVAEYRDGKVLAWAPTQNPQAVQETIAGVLGIKKEDVTCHVTLLGGGFGRKSMPDQVAEAAILSKQLGKPVKIVWSREDDIHCDFFHSVAAMYMKAAVGADGKPTAWLQRTVYPPIGSTFDTAAKYAEDEMGLGWNNLPFDIPNHRAENGPADYHVRIGWLRSVGNIYHAFAIHSFADELAKSANNDSVQYLLDLIGPPRIVSLNLKGDEGGDAKKYPLDTARLRCVVEIAAEKSGWGKRPMEKGRGMGIAAHRSFLTYVATVVEVEVDRQGQVHIPNVWTAVDAGTVVSPDNIRNQFEGAAVFGTSLALFGEITATNGAIDQSNFNDYQIARMSRAPRHIDVHIVKSEAPPAGVGEPGVPPFAPALCNAVFAATGKRVRELPLSKAKLV
ncbi:MAG: molybdopterin cofactor-binding domain-containing protein [Terriglobales bacterium]